MQYMAAYNGSFSDNATDCSHDVAGGRLAGIKTIIGSAGGQAGASTRPLDPRISLYHAHPLDTHIAKVPKLTVRAVRREEPRQVTR